NASPEIHEQHQQWRVKQRKADLICVAERVLISGCEMPGFIGIKESSLRQPDATEKTKSNNRDCQRITPMCETMPKISRLSRAFCRRHRHRCELVFIKNPVREF